MPVAKPVAAAEGASRIARFLKSRASHPAQQLPGSAAEFDPL